MQDGSACGCSLPRRALVAAALAGLVAGDRAAFGAEAHTPDTALRDLLAGNRRFDAHRLTSFAEDLAILRENTVAKQTPFASVLSCSDSRVPVELVFDQSIGHVFVARVAGNVASAEVIASLEYGAAVLETRLVLVLGHSGCGAVKAALEGKDAPGQITALYRSLRPAVDRSGGDLTRAIRENALIQAHLLRTSSPVLGGMIAKGTLAVRAAYYELQTETVTLL